MTGFGRAEYVSSHRGSSTAACLRSRARERGKGSIRHEPSQETTTESPLAQTPPTSSTALVAGLGDVKVRVTAILGRTELTFEEAVELAADRLVALQNQRDEPIELCVNGDVVAHGRLVIVDDSYGVQITKMIQAPKKP
ncbi:MAG: FliM/FliN family flagellar motor switch protein [Candidatus Latescibacterota bacterium]|nr:FliM/FliN family flagellar motor switch protein [Candidatus Latescibacterota bacterium]